MERAPAGLDDKGKSAAAKRAKSMGDLHFCELTNMQAGQNAQILQLLSVPPSMQQPSNELMAAAQSLETLYSAAHADLLAHWPTALESPVLQDELPKLQGTWHR